MRTNDKQPSYPDLVGKVAVVTGGSGGIGAATCRLLAANGAKVVVNGRDQAKLDHVVDSIRASEAEALNGSGEVLLVMGQLDQARARHALALDLAVQVGDTYQQAGAHGGLAHAHAADGNYRAARQHWQHALDLHTRLGVPEAREVLGHLATYGMAMSIAAR
jgi:NADP-dependent 3-hydroxy acid dehydrogenase YdfG